MTLEKVLLNTQVIKTLHSEVNLLTFSHLLKLLLISAKGKSVDATQEFIALGMCNVASSFVRSMPLAASFSRTAVNNATGVRTPLGGLLTGKTFYLCVKI